MNNLVVLIKKIYLCICVGLETKYSSKISDRHDLHIEIGKQNLFIRA